MIAYVSGILAEIEEDSVIVDVGGIGYRVYTSVTEDLVRVGVGNKRRQAGGHNLSLRKPTRSLVVSGIYVACDQRCPDW